MNDNPGMPKVHLGLSGYSYKEWQGEARFYPPRLKQREYLAYYATRYNALEGVGTWRQMPAASSVAKWIGETTEDFRISPKMHQKVTHLARLKPESIEPLNTFIATLEDLKKAGKLGPILLQLPPNFKRNDDLLRTFLSQLPGGDTLSWAIEFRNDTWIAPEVEEILRTFKIAWVAADVEGSEPTLVDTGSTIYARLRKDDYFDDALVRWADYFSGKVADGKECYVYFKHQDAEAPWEWADRLASLLGSNR